MFSHTIPPFMLRQIRDAEDRSDRIHEPVVGLVVDNRDPEKLARVKVTFPTLPGDDTSAWAPIAAPGAGRDRGWFFLPEIDDEVLVMFEHGHIHRPVVVGALWNGVDAPPDQNDGHNPRRSIVSRAGSRIVLDDDQGTVRLEDAAGAGTIEISKEGRITLESPGGDVCVQAPSGDLHVVASEVKLSGTESCHIESLDGIALGADGSITVRGRPLQVHGRKVELNPGGVRAPQATSGQSEKIPDPVDD